MPELGTDPRGAWRPTLAHFFPGVLPWTLIDMTRPELYSMLAAVDKA